MDKLNVYFLIGDDNLLEKYNSADIQKEFDSQSVFNEEFVKTNIKSHVDEVTDRFL